MEKKSEKIKCLTSLCLGVLSVVLGVVPQVLGIMSQALKIPEWIHYEYQDFAVPLWFSSISVGILAIIVGRSRKFKAGIVWGVIGVGLSMLFFLGALLMFCTTISAGRMPRLSQMHTLSRAFQEYCEQNERTLPDADTWCDQLLESVNNVDEFYLWTFTGDYGNNYSRDKDKKRSGYAFNENLDRCQISEINCPTVLLFETDLGWNQNGTSAILPKPIVSSNGRMGFWPFFEGGYPFVLVGPDSAFTVEFVKNSELDSLNWAVKKSPDDKNEDN